MSKFNIYSSSAGSGKTFTLAKEYLKLALGSDKSYYYKRILAITFTNDAASEMKQRILDALKEISDVQNFNEKSKFWKMFRMIADDISLSDEILQIRAGAVFNNIIQEYSDFSVKTIDSFVNQLVSAFTEDLGLPYNYEIVLDKNSVMTEAVERLIEKAGVEEYQDITKVLERFIEEKVSDGKSWNLVTEELANFGNHLINDQYYSSLVKLDSLDPHDFWSISNNIYAYLQWFEDSIVGLANNAIQFIENQGLSVDDFTQKNKGIGGYFYNMRDDFENEYFVKKDKSPNSYHWAAINDDKWYSAKTPTPVKVAIDSIKDDLINIFNEMQEFRDNHLSKFTLFTLLKPNLRKLSLLKKIKKEFDEVLESKNQVFISEFNRKILKIILSEPVPFIYERIGERFNHLLIDEFQDTSDMQFYNLLPLIENSLANNHFNLIVGDAKQAIYRWRGGKMDLIVQLFKKDIEPLIQNPLIQEFQIEQFLTVSNYITSKNLTTNYRSSREIIEFNNRFFETVLNDYQHIYKFLPNVYSDFRQEIPENAKSGGHVQIEFLNYVKGEDLMLSRTVEIIEKVLAEGYSMGDIAILCRKNKESAEIANFLTEANYKIISRDSLLLKNSPIVRLLVAFMRVVNQPDNRLAKSEVAYLFYQIILGQIPDNQANDLISEAVDAPQIVDFYTLFTQHGFELDIVSLTKAGIYELAEKIIHIFKLFERTDRKSYIFRFLDVVLNFSLKESNHLQDFLKYWDEKKNSSSLSVKSPSEEQAITITTIHRSKGLEYPVVIIPYAQWDTRPNHYSELWANLEEVDYEEFKTEKQDGFAQLASAPIKINGMLEMTELGPQYARELEATFLENLNMLYVAFTRAVDKLFVISGKNHHQKIQGVGDLMYGFLSAAELFVPEQNQFVVYEGRFIKKEEPKTEILDVIHMPKVVSEDRSHRLRLRRISEKIFDSETLDKTKDRVNKLHEAFVKIKTRKDISKAIQLLEFEGVISPKESESIKENIEKIISLPELKPLFEDGLQVENQREILLNGAEAQCPDRVVMKDGVVYIIDYQTGSSHDTQRHERNARQVRNYGKLYQQMGYEKVAMMIVYLSSNEVINVA
ncbi:UvrD/REP helicase [Emticicia oligotrophica DSM 17448]|uniref:DNA 3'-5' helicase n=1 Tax=Emticicia oligotrophica (strain DSM 17448 / CIP 109782 / MTCC 6937 / GPTSA100-15) TaxID=929562 RepID=A0ABN4AIP1_EMTOG|nr:UvrD-helicase domain-containing protein [Emticicia oligotrophica]AFK01855.1 UvrD/REP helicase [Emticicia oligotrophica DSM 17448]